MDRPFPRAGRLAAPLSQGARLIGIYDSQVAFGQSRVLLVWTRLIMPKLNNFEASCRACLSLDGCLAHH
nr:TrbI/VirB10 family protein [Bradyrhizobium arachidis]